MSYDDDPDDDEDWHDDGDSGKPDESQTGHCPECHGPVYEFTNKCPACGYLLTAADRRQLWSAESKPKWVLITATIVLVILMLGVLTLRF
jgi:ribosomal protein L37E